MFKTQDMVECEQVIIPSGLNILSSDSTHFGVDLLCYLYRRFYRRLFTFSHFVARFVLFTIPDFVSVLNLSQSQFEELDIKYRGLQ